MAYVSFDEYFEDVRSAYQGKALPPLDLIRSHYQEQTGQDPIFQQGPSRKEFLEFNKNSGLTEDDLDDRYDNIYGSSLWSEAKRGLQRGLGNLAGSVGTALDVIEDFGSDIMGIEQPKGGQAVERYWDEKIQEVPRSAASQGDVLDNPVETLTNPSWWAAGLPEIATSQIPTIAAAAAGGPLGAMLAGGSLEGLSTYRTARDKGLSVPAARGLGMGVAAGGLNAIPFMGTATTYPRAIAGGMLREGLTEAAEEYPGALLEGETLAEANRRAANVAPLAAVSGGANIYGMNVQPRADTGDFENVARDLQPDTLQGTVERVTGGWEGGPNVEIVQSGKNLPDSVKSLGEDIEAAYDGEGTIYMVEDNIAPERREAVLFHEALGHYGMERAMPDFNQFLSQVNSLIPRDPVLSGIYRGVQEQYAQEPPAIQTAETLARYAEQFPNTKHPVIERIYASLREFARQLGFNPNLNRADLNRAMRNAMKGMGQTTGRAKASIPPPDKVQEVRRTKDGRIYGGPQGLTTQQDFDSAVNEVVKLATDPMAVPEQSAWWYEESGQYINTLSNGDETLREKMLRLVAYFSQATQLGGNAKFLVDSAYQIARGEEIRTGRFPNAMAPTIKAIVDAKEMNKSLPDVNDKVMSFYRNLKDGATGLNEWADESTIDRWMWDVLGYKGGREHSAGSAQYAYAREIMKDAAAKLSEQTGQEFRPRNIQAMLWTHARNRESAAKAEEKGQLDQFKPTTSHLGDYLENATAMVNYEAVPSTSTPLYDTFQSLTPEGQQDFIARANETLNGINELLGLPLTNTGEGTGMWEGVLNPNSYSGIVLPGGITKGYESEAAELYANMVGYIFNQDAVLWHRPNFFGNPSQAKTAAGVSLKVKGGITDQEMADALSDAGVIGFSKVMLPDGTADYRALRLPFGKETAKERKAEDTAFFDSVQKALNNVGPDAEIFMDQFRAEWGMPENNWSENPNGESYKQRLGEAGRPDIQEWADSRRADFEQALSEASIKTAKASRAPSKTVKAYKLFRKKPDGNLYAMMVDANTPIPVGEWMDAKAGEMTDKGKVKSRIGPLSYRPGWHAAPVPVARQIGAKDPAYNKPLYRNPDEVWAEVELSADTDYQQEAEQSPGKRLTKIPENGMYRYNNAGDEWMISGKMRINRELSDQEVQEINQSGAQDLARPEAVAAAIEKIQSERSTFEDNSPARLKHRAEVADQLQDNYGYADPQKAPQSPPQERQAVLVLGPPGAGKSFIQAQIAPDWALSDPDEAKVLLDGFNGGAGANTVHEESKAISEDVTSDLIDQGYNVFMPLVGHDKAKVDRKIAELESRGYTVRVGIVHVSPGKSLQRALERWQRTGRFIDPSYITDTVGDKPLEVFKQLVQEGKADADQAYTTERDRGERLPIDAGAGRPGAGRPMASVAEGTPEAPTFQERVTQSLAKFTDIDPQVVDAVVTMSQNARAPIEAQRRGTRTWDDTANAAAKMLADDMGFKNVSQLIAAGPGTTANAEQLVVVAGAMNEALKDVEAARDALLQNDSPENQVNFKAAMDKLAFLQAPWMGFRAEAGRALNILRQTAPIAENVNDLVDAYIRNPESMRALAEKMAKGDVGKAVRKEYTPGFLDKLKEWFYNSILSGPATHMVNLGGNAMFGFTEEMAKQVGLRLTGDAKAANARLRAFTLGIQTGLHNAGEAFKTELPQLDQQTKIETQPEVRAAIGGPAGRLIRTPGRALMAEDEFFKGVGYTMELAQLAMQVADGDTQLAQEIMRNPTRQMQKQAVEAARRMTFTNKLGPGMAAINNALNQSKVGKFVVPFVQTPTNLIKRSFDYSPFGLAQLPYETELANDLKGKNGKDKQAIALTRQAIGLGITGLVYSLAAAGLISGGGSPDRKENNLRRMRDGWQPYSIKIGDKWVSYLRFDPLSVPMGIVADMHEVGEMVGEKDATDLGVAVFKSIVNNVTNKTWMSGVSDFVQMMNEPKRYTENWINRFASSFVAPNIIGQPTYYNDEYMRTSRGFIDQVKSRYPGYRQELARRLDLSGQPIKNPAVAVGGVPSPIRASQATAPDPVADAMLEAGVIKGMPSRKVRGVELSEEEYEQYASLVQQSRWKALTPIVTSPGFQRAPKMIRGRILEDMWRKAGDQARAMYLMQNPSLLARIAGEQAEALTQ